MSSSRDWQGAARVAVAGNAARVHTCDFVPLEDVHEEPEDQVAVVKDWVFSRLSPILSPPILRRSYFKGQAAWYESSDGEAIQGERRWFELTVQKKNLQHSIATISIGLPFVDCCHQTTSGGYQVSDTVSGLNILSTYNRQCLFNYLEGTFVGLNLFSRANVHAPDQAQRLGYDSFPAVDLLMKSPALRQSSFLRNLIDIEIRLRLGIDKLPGGIVRQSERVARQWCYLILVFLPARRRNPDGWRERFGHILDRFKGDTGAEKVEPLPELWGQLRLLQQVDGRFSVQMVSRCEKWQRDNIAGLLEAVFHLHGILRGALIARA